MADRPLIVNADDFGLTERTSGAIMRAHREGIVTSTSVLCLTEAFASSMKMLRDSIDVGVHLAVVGEDPPLLSSNRIPSLASGGRLPFSWRSFLVRASLGRVDPSDIEQEFSAQIDRVVTVWPRITHLDCHQHLQLWPAAGRVVVRLAESLGVSIRVPRSRSSGPRGVGINKLSRGLANAAARSGVKFAQDFAGLDEAGHMRLERLRSALRNLAGGHASTAEIGTHPGEDHDPSRARYRWGYEWGAELFALTSPVATRAVEEGGFRLSRRAELFS